MGQTTIVVKAWRPGLKRPVRIDLPAGSTVGDVARLFRSSLDFACKHYVALLQTELVYCDSRVVVKDGDLVEFYPLLVGGCEVKPIDPSVPYVPSPS